MGSAEKLAGCGGDSADDHERRLEQTWILYGSPLYMFKLR